LSKTAPQEKENANIDTYNLVIETKPTIEISTAAKSTENLENVVKNNYTVEKPPRA